MDSSNDFLPRQRPTLPETGYHWIDEEFASEYPALYAILAVARMDGDVRVGASITLFCDNGELKFVACDRQTDQSLFGTLDAAKPFWEQLEAFLRAHPESWRKRKDALPRRGRA